MKRFRRRKKYQRGGVIPDFTGAQVLGQGMNINQQVNPIRLDPSAAFQALNVREASKRSAISLGQLNRAERQDIWAKEIDQRDFIDRKLTALRTQSQASLDSLTNLDLSDPKQMALAQDMRRQIEEATANGEQILVDPTLSPKERMQRLSEVTGSVQQLMSDPEYQRQLQANAITKKFYDDMALTMTGDDFIRHDIADQNMDLARAFQRGEISYAEFAKGVKDYTVPAERLASFEDRYDQMTLDALDPEKQIGNWEKYRTDDGFLVHQKRVTVPSLEDQVKGHITSMKEDPDYKYWTMQMEREGRFVDENGAFSEEALENYVRGKIQMMRRSLGDAGRDFITEIDVDKPNSSGRELEAVRKRRELEEGISEKGYKVDNPIELENLNKEILQDAGYSTSPTGLINFINASPRDLVGDGDPEFYSETQQAILNYQKFLQGVIKPKDIEQKEREAEIFRNSPFFVGPRDVSDATGGSANPNANFVPPRNVDPALGLVMGLESGPTGTQLINRNDLSQASVGPLQFRGELGNQWLESLGIEGFDLSKPLTSAQADELEDALSAYTLPDLQNKAQDFWSDNMMPQTDKALESAPTFNSLLDFNDPAIRYPLFSMSVNHSPEGQEKILRNAEEMLTANFENPEEVSKEDLIRILQEARMQYVDSLDIPQSTKDALEARYRSELDASLSMIGQPFVQSQQPVSDYSDVRKQIANKLRANMAKAAGNLPVGDSTIQLEVTDE